MKAWQSPHECFLSEPSSLSHMDSLMWLGDVFEAKQWTAGSLVAVVKSEYECHGQF